uniref:TNFR-Cys domain-containing protein n=1 Tax=Chelydra serpentina TaxID=8475 RepID=A0A8C3RVS0_CHESE
MGPGLANMSAGLLLLLCLLAHEAKSASVSLAQDLERPQLIPVALSRSTEDSEFYKHEDRLCRKCPAGSHVEEHCVTSKTSGKCSQCEEGAEFTEYPNALSKCLTCRVCRKDEVQLSGCNSSKNTQCTCKNGTFCSPDHPCEICQRCRLSCPEGEVQVSSCTPQSDIQCVHPTGPPPPVAGGITGWAAAGIAALLILVLLVVLLLCCYGRNSSSRGDPRKKSVSFKFPLTKAHVLSPLRNCTRARLGTQDNMRNEQLDQESQHGLLAASDCKEAVRKNSRCETTTPSAAESAPKQEVLQRNPASIMASRRRKLVPGKDPIESKCWGGLF